MRTGTRGRKSKVPVAGHLRSRISGYWMTEDRKQKRGADKCVMAFLGWIIEDGRLVYAAL
ncbi:MAG: hypothetical protein AMJ43_08200 [Coxiella sp. DG_40]|nr:MAG: hypothetical protein AMJ43_08200 [Coxiella sp. DG_40]